MPPLTKYTTHFLRMFVNCLQPLNDLWEYEYFGDLGWIWQDGGANVDQSRILSGNYPAGRVDQADSFNTQWQLYYMFGGYTDTSDSGTPNK